MNIRTKKSNPDGIVRLETSGEIKEILINEDFLKPKDVRVSLCFKGKSSSGIVELTIREIEIIQKQVAPKMDSLKNIKVMKFKK